MMRNAGHVGLAAASSAATDMTQRNDIRISTPLEQTSWTYGRRRLALLRKPNSQQLAAILVDDEISHERHERISQDAEELSLARMHRRRRKIRPP